VWFGFTKNEVALLDGDRVRVFGPNQGIHIGNVTAIHGRGPRVWIGGEFGLQQFDAGPFSNINAVNNEWLRGISGIIETANGDLWLNGSTGIFHVLNSELEQAVKEPSYKVKGNHFDRRDGLPGFATQVRPLPSAIEGTDGRLWFATTGGIVWVDPTHPERRAVAPHVTVESVSANGKFYPPDLALRFPAHTSDVQIGYQAVSLSNPEAIRLRYKLQETDREWHEVSTAEPVTYRNLAPGSYHFSVNATDPNGVWSDALATSEFTILPAFYQTGWFMALCVLAFVVLLWSIYRLRLRQLARQFDLTLETRIDERTRIARELHDTLLQSFQGLTLNFQRARNLLPGRTSDAIQTLDAALDGAEQAIVESRDAIHDPRSPTAAPKGLEEEIKALCEELVAKGTDEKEPMEFRIVVEGSAYALKPDLHTEIFRIAREALRNAFSHSRGRLIETELAYTEDLFRLRIRDNGKGIDPDQRLKAERRGHWGLRGMRERTEHLGGKLEVWSEPGAGTEIELRIPAALAYETVRSRNGWRFWRRERSQ
jgi:signal transduction histidine kinase